jgi:hypothetical protein
MMLAYSRASLLLDSVGHGPDPPGVGFCAVGVRRDHCSSTIFLVSVKPGAVIR